MTAKKKTSPPVIPPTKTEIYLEKLLIIELLKLGVKRDDIRKILTIGADKISSIQKYLSKEKQK